MRMVRMSARLLACVLCLAAAVPAQFGPSAPSIPGVWSPLVGSGAAYQMEANGKKSEYEVAIVGQETVNGQTAYWMEMYMKEGARGAMVVKTLTVKTGPDVITQRTIFQMPGEPAMEMDSQFMAQMGGRRPEKQEADFRERAEKVGTETITVPAGTFECEHWRSKDKKSDIWFSTKIAPYGLVKSVSPNSSMVLTRVITDAKTRITGPVRKFDMQEMMRKAQERP